jgi:hypothetical protein
MSGGIFGGGGGGTGAVDSVAGKVGTVTLIKDDVGLSNVTNDAQLKVASNLADLPNPVTAKTNLSLENVNNTSDANKPVSAAQLAALNLKVNTSLLGANSGVATLDVNGRLVAGQIPDSVLSNLSYQGGWNANTNTPTLSTVPASGTYYKVTTAGTTTLSGISSWGVGDWVISNGTAWEKISQTETVSSVAGKTGAVTLNSTDVGLGNVNNTADTAKPVSTLQQAALDLKQNILAEGAFVDGDKTKLSGIEAGATADQTASEIETAYNSQVAVVSQVDAETGTSTTVGRWTPQRVAQAIAALAPSGSGGGGVTWNFITATGNISVSNGYFMDATVDDQILTAPASPSVGDYIAIFVAGGSKNIYLAGNTKNIEGTTNNALLLASEFYEFVYSGVTTGWRRIGFYYNGGVGGLTYGFVAGGDHGASNTERYNFSSTASSANYGTIDAARTAVAAMSNSTYGYVAGGYAGANVSTISRNPIASATTATNVSNLTVAREISASQKSSVKAYFSGGLSSSSVIDKMVLSTESTSNTFNLTTGLYRGCGQSSTVNGYHSGGATTTAVQKFSFSTETTATTVLALVSARYGSAGHSSSTHGHVAGGNTGVNVNTVDRFSFSSDTNASNVGSLAASRSLIAGASSADHGYSAGGEGSTSTIDRYSFSTLGTATGIGSLVSARNSAAGYEG